MTRNAHKLEDWGHWCAGQTFQPENMTRILWLLGYICNFCVYHVAVSQEIVSRWKIELIRSPFTTNTKFCSVCHRLAVIWTGHFGPSFGVLQDQSCTNRKQTHYFPISANTNFCSIRHCLAVTSRSNYAPQIWPPLGCKVGHMGRPKMWTI